MTEITNPIPDDRPLTIEEESLVHWLLEHGNEEGVLYQSQVDQLRVISRCGCGCASIDFSVNGDRPSGQVMGILADFGWASDGNLFGIFVFERGGLLAGLEVWSVDGKAIPSQLPSSDQLQPLIDGSTN